MLIRSVVDYAKSIETLQQKVAELEPSIEKVSDPEMRGMLKAHYSYLIRSTNDLVATSENLIDKIDRVVH